MCDLSRYIYTRYNTMKNSRYAPLEIINSKNSLVPKQRKNKTNKKYGPDSQWKLLDH